jgi:hypothetical protein
MSKTTTEKAKELARNSTDCSFLLSHLIRQNDGKTDTEACAVLCSILGISGEATPYLRSSVNGWYGSSAANLFNPVTSQFDGTPQNKAVCFTEATLSGLKAHRDLFNVKYGLAFDREWLFTQGANPCLNIAEVLLKATFVRTGETYSRSVFNFIPPHLHPFVNVIHESFDATHEREWRYPGGLNFSIENVRFIFCPESEFKVFSSVQKGGMPCLFDLAWLDRV